MATEQTRPDSKAQGSVRNTGGDGRSMEPHKAAAADAPSPRHDGDFESLGRFLDEARLMHRSLFGELVDRVSTEDSLPDMVQVAHELVRTGVLTAYQAAAIYQGKGKSLLIGPYIVLTSSA